MTSTTDDRIRDGLQRLADRAHVPIDGRARIDRRLKVRRRRRRVAVGVAAAALVGGIAGVGVLGGSDAERREATVASVADDATDVHEELAPPAAPPTPEERLPRLTLTFPGMTLVDASIHRDEFTPDQLVESAIGYRHFQSFRPATDDWSEPSFYVFTSLPGDNFGIGEESPPETTTRVDVNGTTGYLSVSGGHRSLGWRLADGTAAYILAPGVPPDELVEIARSMTPRPNSSGWELGYLPPGLIPVVDDANRMQPSIASQTLTFESDAGRVELNSYTTTPVDFEARIADYSIDADVASTTIDGHPAAVTRSQHDVRVLWYEDANAVGSYLIIDGDLRDDVDALVAGLTRLDPAQWEDLLASVGATYWSGDESSTSTSAP